MSFLVPGSLTTRRIDAAYWLAALVLLGVVLARTAWLCDDAFFTLRTVDNALHGFGPRWNVAERVQAFTHPLWMLLLWMGGSVGLPLEGFAMAAGALCSLAAVGLLTRQQSPWTVAFITAMFVGSKSLIDFSTSGLEGGLTYLLLAIATGVGLPATRRASALRWLCLGLLPLARPDLILFSVPLALHGRDSMLGSRTTRIALLLGPLVAWQAFSVAYYGALLPNTALAKLGVGIPTPDRLAHGATYIASSIAADWTAGLILCLGLWTGFRCGRGWIASLCLYLGYVTWIGGDFMLGRFLIPPLFLSLCCVASRPPLAESSLRRAAVVVVALGLAGPRPPVFAGADYGNQPDSVVYRDLSTPNGLSDERAFYFQEFGWLSGREPLPRPVREVEPRLEVSLGGFVPYVAGPPLHRVDPQALADPFLARIALAGTPPSDYKAGHFAREVPPGYLDSLVPGRSWDLPAEASDLLLDVRLATRGPLLQAGRLAAIQRLAYRDLGRLLGIRSPLVVPPTSPATP